MAKKEGVSGRNRGHWEEGLWGTYFSSKYITLLIWGNYKIVFEEGFGGFRISLYEYYKYSICYDILKIKNILIISINLSLTKKTL